MPTCFLPSSPAACARSTQEAVGMAASRTAARGQWPAGESRRALVFTGAESSPATRLSEVVPRLPLTADTPGWRDDEWNDFQTNLPLQSFVVVGFFYGSAGASARAARSAGRRENARALLPERGGEDPPL